MEQWKNYLQTHRVLIMLSGVWFSFSLFIFNRVLVYVQNDPGIPFNDPVFGFYQAKDLSLPIFFLTYGSLVTFLVVNRKQPHHYVLCLQAYGWMVMLRSISVYLLPLSEPPGALPLNDPVLNTFFYPGGYSPRDLFFSGHTGTIMLFAYLTDSKTIKILLFSIALFTGFLLVLQKVHYSIDVLAAPVLMVPVFAIIKAQRKIN